jgi:hypothetical protein
MGARKTTFWPDEFGARALSSVKAPSLPALGATWGPSLAEPLPWTPSVDACRARARRRHNRPALSSCAVHPPGPVSFSVVLSRPQRRATVASYDAGQPWDDLSVQMTLRGGCSDC